MRATPQQHPAEIEMHFGVVGAQRQCRIEVRLRGIEVAELVVQVAKTVAHLGRVGRALGGPHQDRCRLCRSTGLDQHRAIVVQGRGVSRQRGRGNGMEMNRLVPMFLFAQRSAQTPCRVAIGTRAEKARELGDRLVMALQVGVGHAEVEVHVTERRIEPQGLAEARDGRFETTLLAQGVAQIHYELRRTGAQRDGAIQQLVRPAVLASPAGDDAEQIERVDMIRVDAEDALSVLRGRPLVIALERIDRQAEPSREHRRIGGPKRGWCRCRGFGLRPMAALELATTPAPARIVAANRSGRSHGTHHFENAVPSRPVPSAPLWMS